MSEQDVTPNQKPFKIKPKLVVIVIAIVVFIILISSSLFVVDQTEEAIVLLFGRMNRTAAPGLHLKLPFGIEKNYNVPTQVIQNMSFGFRTAEPGITTAYSPADYPEESIMLTGDLNIIDVEWVIQYRIVDAQAWLFNVENKEKTIRDISQSIINRLVGDRAILDVIGSERPNIELQGQEQMNEIFRQYGLGINVTTVKLRNIVPPAGEVQDAFEDVNKSVQDMNRFINEGKEAYNAEIPKARGQADQMVQVAEGYAAERVNEARGDVARFNSVYAEYRTSREVTRTRLYIEMMEDVFGEDTDTDLIDRNLENFIPLKQLRNQSAGGTQ
ncbi:MAG: FtsH protease activity modulator HflK [Spirochaetota bacterium]